MSGHSFSFVSVDQTGQPRDVKDNSTVRRTAMKAFRRKERLQRVKAFQNELAAKADADGRHHGSAVVQPREPGLLTPAPSVVPSSASSGGSSPPGSAFSFVPSSYGLELAKEQPDSRSRTSKGFEGGSIVSSSSLWNLDDSKNKSCTDVSKMAMSPTYHERVCTVGATKVPVNLSFTKDYTLESPAGLTQLVDHLVTALTPMLSPTRSEANFTLLSSPPGGQSESLIHHQIGRQRGIASPELKNDQGIDLAKLQVKQALQLLRERVNTSLNDVESQLLNALTSIAASSNLKIDNSEEKLGLDAFDTKVELDSSSNNQSWQFIQSWLTSSSIATSNSIATPPITIEPPLIAEEPPQSSNLCTEENLFIVSELRRLTTLKQSLTSTRYPEPSDLTTFNTSLASLQSHLQTTAPSPSPPSTPSFSTYFLETCHFAALLYIHLALHPLPDPHQVHTLSTSLQTSILHTEAFYANASILPDSQTPYAGTLLWALFVGGSLAQGSEATTWYASRISLVVPWTGARDWTDVQEMLSAVVWIAGLGGAQTLAVWQEVELILGMPVVAEVGGE